MEIPENDPDVFLHWLVPPVRLLCAAMWQLMQQESVPQYAVLEECVSLITETLPDLLSYREKTQLTLGLRARLVLELCGTKASTDPEIIQSHLQRIQMLLALYRDLESDGEEGVEEPGRNFVALVQLLMTDPAERSSFFESVFPVHYGVNFSKALKQLMWQFVLRLEKALPQPTVEETAHMLSATPAVLKKCVQSLSQPQQLKKVFEYKREVCDGMNDSPLGAPVEDCILSSLGTPRIVQIVLDEQTPIYIHSVLDFPSSHCQEVLLEAVITDHLVDNEVEISSTDSDHHDAGGNAEHDPQSLNMVDAKMTTELPSVDLQAAEPGLEDESVTESIEVTDHQKRDDDQATGQQEETELVKLCMLKQACVNLERLDLSKAAFSQNMNSGAGKRSRDLMSRNDDIKASCKGRKRKRNVTYRGLPRTRSRGLEDVDSSNQQLKTLYSKTKGSSEAYACSLCTFQDLDEIQMHHHLTAHHPNEYKQSSVCTEEKIMRTYRGVPICKTCPECGKTFARGSGMRRHMLSHTSEHPFACPSCGKAFRYTFDLKRHQLNACVSQDYVVVVQKKDDGVLPMSSERLPSSVPLTNPDVSQEAVEAGDNDSRNSSRKRHVKLSKSANGTASNSGTLPLVPPSSVESMEQGGVKKSEHSYSIGSISSLSKRHPRSSSSDSPYKCCQCGIGFKYSFNLKKHEDVCEESAFCSTSLFESSQPEVHENQIHEHETITDESEAVGLDAPKSPSGSTSDSEIRHLVPLQVTYLENEVLGHTNGSGPSPVISKLKRHPRRTAADLPQKCSQCGQGFKYSYNLKKHEDICKETGSSSSKKARIVSTPSHVSSPEAGTHEKHDQNVTGMEDLEVLADSEEVADSLRPSDGISSEMTALVLPDVSKSVSEHECSSSLNPVGSHSKRLLRSPTVKRPYKCSQCGDGFKYSHNLKKHEDVCLGDKRHSGSDQSHSKDTKDGILNIKGSVGTFVVPSLNNESKEDDKEQLKATGRVRKAAHTDSLLTCDKCETTCKNSYFLKKHKFICANRERSYKCVKCDAVFKTLPGVKKHLQSHWGEDPQQCSQCSKYFLSSGELAKHTMAHDRVCSYPCTLCPEILDRLDALRRHYLDAHDFRGPYQCSHCNKTHKDLGAMVAHMGTHSEDRPFRCPQCPKRFKQRSALTIHERHHSGDKPFLCEKCGKCFGNNIQLQRHFNSHRTERPHECPRCKKHFKTRHTLRVHLLNHSRLTSFPCEVCGKLFTQMGGLVRHLLTHTGERPFSCPKCGKTFLTRYEVGKHMRYHTGERPFQCQHCSKSFTQACYLSTHTRIHTGEKPYPCSVCNKAFISSSRVKRHMLVHTKEKPFQCDCGKAFNQKHLVKTHKCSLKKNS